MHGALGRYPGAPCKRHRCSVCAVSASHARSREVVAHGCAPDVAQQPNDVSLEGQRHQDHQRHVEHGRQVWHVEPAPVGRVARQNVGEYATQHGGRRRERVAHDGGEGHLDVVSPPRVEPPALPLGYCLSRSIADKRFPAAPARPSLQRFNCPSTVSLSVPARLSQANAKGVWGMLINP